MSSVPAPVVPGAPPPSNGLLRLLAGAIVVVVVAVVLHGLADLVVVAALVVMVMVHEAGHFATAKWSKMKVTEYFLGFGPRLWSFRHGETEYGVKAVPAGGYVRIVGMTMLEEVDPADEARSYRQASFPRRLAVAVAGSATHFVMAFLLLFAMVCFAGMPVSAPSGVIEGFTPFVGHANPAEAAGIRPGDVLYSIDGRRETNATAYIATIEASTGTPLRLVVRRAGRLVHLVVTPVDGRALTLVTPIDGHARAKPAGSRPEGVIGVELSGTRYVTENPLVSLGRAGSLLGSVTAATVTGIGDVFSLHGLHDFAHQVATATDHPKAGTNSSGSSSGSSQLLSLPGAVEVGAQALQQHVSNLLYILVAINLFVGIVNLFPMLPLDGGHVAIAIYERVRSRRGHPYHADVAKLMPVAYLFLAFMVIVGIGALYANIVNPPMLNGG